MHLFPQLPVTFLYPLSSSFWIIFNAFIMSLLSPYFFFSSLSVCSLSSSLPQANLFLQSHPALWGYREYWGSVLLSDLWRWPSILRYVREPELREIYFGCLGYTEFSYCEHSLEEKKRKHMKREQSKEIKKIQEKKEIMVDFKNNLCDTMLYNTEHYNL